MALQASATNIPPENTVDEIEISADQIVSSPGTPIILANGNVRLRAGDLILRASSLRLQTEDRTLILEPPFVLESDGVSMAGEAAILSLSTSTVVIRQPSLHLLGSGSGLRVTGDQLQCTRKNCTISMASGTGCPHDPPGYFLRSRQVLVHPSGDVDLSRPVLELNGTPVAALPWIRIRPEGSAGFLAPRLGWDADAGLIAGPAGHIPLGPHSFAQGHVAVRTSQGLETSTRLHAPGARVNVQYLLEAPNSHGRVRVHLAPPFEGASMVVDLDVADGRRIVDSLAITSTDRAISHTSSRTRFSAGNSTLQLETHATLLSGFGPGGAVSGNLSTSSVGVGAHLAPTPTVGPLWPRLDLKVSRFDSLDTGPTPGATGTMALPHLRIDGSPAIQFPARLGPLSVLVDLSSHHRGWLPDAGAQMRSHRHVAMAGANVEFPLIGNPFGFRHLIVPFAAYRILPWMKGSHPQWVVDPMDMIRTGHGIELGVTSELASQEGDTRLELAIFERFDLPGFGNRSAPAYLFASIKVGPRWLRLATTGSLDHQRNLLSFADASISTEDARGSQLKLGTTYYAPGRGAHTDGGWILTAPPVFALNWAQDPARSLELNQRARAAFTQTIAGVAGARVGIAPTTALHALWYGVELSSSCQCIKLALMASHRLNSPVPDIIASLTLDQF